MRIIGTIPHPQLVITVFKMDTRYTLKVEIGPFEQHYKYLESDTIQGFEDIKALVTEDKIKEWFGIFDKMNESYNQLKITN